MIKVAGNMVQLYFGILSTLISGWAKMKQANFKITPYGEYFLSNFQCLLSFGVKMKVLGKNDRIK